MRGEKSIVLPLAGRTGFETESGQPVASEAVNSDSHASQLLAEVACAGRLAGLVSYCLNRSFTGNLHPANAIGTSGHPRRDAHPHGMCLIEILREILDPPLEGERRNQAYRS